MLSLTRVRRVVDDNHDEGDRRAKKENGPVRANEVGESETFMARIHRQSPRQYLIAVAHGGKGATDPETLANGLLNDERD